MTPERGAGRRASEALLVQQMRPVVEIVANDEVNQHWAERSRVRQMLLARAVDHLHLGDQALQLALEAPVLGDVFDATGKAGLRKQVFLVPKMLDAALDQPVGVRKDARPSRA